jgi:lipoprotein signal peptidase
MPMSKFRLNLLCQNIAFRLIALVCILDWASKTYFALILTNKPYVSHLSPISLQVFTAIPELLLAPFVLDYFFANLHFKFALAYHYIPVFAYLFETGLILVVFFCFYLIGSGRFFLKKKTDLVLFGFFAGGVMGNAVEQAITGKVVNWFGIIYTNIDELATHVVIINAADFVITVTIPVAVVILAIRTGIYLLRLRKG